MKSLVDLKSRLNALRNQSGTQSTPTTKNVLEKPSQATSISERIQRLRPQSNVPQQQKRNLTDHELAHILNGTVIDDGVIQSIHSWPVPYLHGKQTLQPIQTTSIPEPISQGQTLERENYLFVDTETSGLAGGVGTHAFLFGAGRFRQGRFELIQLMMTRPSAETAYLEKILALIEPDTVLVSYNGKRFDLPLLQTRLRLNGLHPIAETLAHLDLLYPTRVAFANRWDNCRLQTAENRLLGFFRTDDLPGAQVPEVWQWWLRFGQSRQLPRVFSHNRDDLLTLAALLSALVEVFKISSAPVPNSQTGDPVSIARAYCRHGKTDLAIRLLKNCQSHLDANGLMELAAHFRRQQQWQQAIRIWQHLAQSNHLEAMERLAKYHEHQSHDLQQARQYTTLMLAQQPSNERFQRRLKRIESKLERINP
ncbi:MAG: ribonuclease H-like domain-containing protein [Magnetococcales bacterium]|nr:ribonuclease H-like domain-containing protein [Magnetococcales bacterium]